MTDVVDVSAILPDYPESNTSGYTYVVPLNLRKFLSQKDIMQGVCEHVLVISCQLDTD